MSQHKTAHAFFGACETGKGWIVCQDWCLPDATFSCQADALTDMTTLSAYVEWMKGLLVSVPDGHYVLKAFATDEARDTAVVAAEFHGTQTGEGGPVAPTGKSVISQYAYVIQFDGDKISHLTKIWNDVHALRGLGWA